MRYNKVGHKFLSFCHNPRVWLTDRQTDRPTEKPCNTVRFITCTLTVEITTLAYYAIQEANRAYSTASGGRAGLSKLALMQIHYTILEVHDDT